MLVSGSVPFLTIVAVISLFFVSHLAEIAHLSAGKRKELRPIPLCEVGAEGQEGAAPCVPEDSVYFLKVPKCGSTTVFQVLIAYGVKHGLTFALPVRISLDPLSPKILCPDCRSPDGRYNMVVSHAQYNKEGVKQVMKEGAKYVAIVREAASHYESLWGYNGYEKTLHMDLKTFIRTNHNDTNKDPPKFVSAPSVSNPTEMDLKQMKCTHT
ncbi:galactosylceramide sulfotransferase-like [Penaeus japonicus]|uniref:galactosylceramide sulfotransferase-like n=1 Tax=Penaeus japonicus TaxID=27405 RepID=UPI001C71782E|nr:galactosylceramide sulfotransferase-like [Penaeus japonicus]